MTDDHSKQLGDALETALLDAGLQWIDVARAADISLSTLDRIRKGHGTRRTRRAVERALHLEQGSIEHFLEHGAMPDPQADSPTVAWLRGEYMRRVAEDGQDAAEDWIFGEIQRLNAEFD